MPMTGETQPMGHDERKEFPVTSGLKTVIYPVKDLAPAKAVGEVGGGRLIASVTDADGNVIGLIQSH
jgi:hypothetical protein